MPRRSVSVPLSEKLKKRRVRFVRKEMDEERLNVWNIHFQWRLNTVLVLRMAHRIWTETKQHPGTAEPDNMLGCCLISFYFLWAILSTSTVYLTQENICYQQYDDATGGWLNRTMEVTAAAGIIIYLFCWDVKALFLYFEHHRHRLITSWGIAASCERDSIDRPLQRFINHTSPINRARRHRGPNPRSRWRRWCSCRFLYRKRRLPRGCRDCQILWLSLMGLLSHLLMPHYPIITVLQFKWILTPLSRVRLLKNM